MTTRTSSAGRSMCGRATQSLIMAIFASMMVGPTERGDAMFMAMANRSAQMAADLDAATIIRGR